MEKLINLEDLLRHAILDLYSAEEQIIEALPAMIEKAGNANLKEALQNHLGVTVRHKERLDKIKTVLTGEKKETEEKGFFSKLFGGADAVKCKGTEGLIEEAQKLMDTDANADIMDAAIIGAAQKVEHYEIASYGTAHAYSKELKMDFIALELEKTLKEEYEANDLLTELATGGINIVSAPSMKVNKNNEDTILKDHPIPGVDHLATSPIKTVIPAGGD